MDLLGNLVIVGTTSSADFPLISPLISMSNASGFVVKLDSKLTRIVFSTRLGGNAVASTSANAVALDTAGNIYVAGSTRQTDFPVTPEAFQTTGPVPSSFGGPTDLRLCHRDFGRWQQHRLFHVLWIADHKLQRRQRLCRGIWNYQPKRNRGG